MTAHAQQSVERLETRLYLSGLTSYSTASSDWFGVVDASFTSSSGLNGSSSSSGSSGDNAMVRQFLVRLTPEATAQAGSLAGVQNLISDNDVELVVTDGLGLPGQVIVSTTERDSVQVVRSLDDNPAVAYFEEDFSVGAAQLPSEDASSPEFTRQYGLNNTGQSGGVADVDIDAPEAWDITTGSVETVVSVIDSGVDFTHPDLYLNIWLNQGELPAQFESSLSDADSDGLITFRDLNDAANSSFVTDLNGNGYIDAGDLLDDPTWADGIDTDNNGFEDDLVGWDFFENDNKPFDEHRHGTHVAGILGAVGDNGIGVSGVNWETSVMALRFLDEDNRGDVSSAVEAINYTTMMRTRTEDAVNVRVSNNSWGSSGAFSQTLFDAVAGNLRADILFVAAAGNGDVLGQGVDNDDVSFFPANLDLANVISVAAINDRGELASFSNFGTTTVDIAAPGVGIVSTDLGGEFISRSGTSMATPFVAGTAALVFDVFPEATAAEVRDAILSGAVVSGSLDGFIAGSRSLNAVGALTASTFAPVPELVPVATITADGTLNVDITVTYIDDGSVDISSFDIRDVEVTRQGFSETLLTPASATTTTVNVDGQDRDAAVYRFTAPGGTFDATENGTWIVSLREGEIQDDLGLYSAPRELGPFTVSVDATNIIFVNTTLDTIDADLGDGQPTDASGRISLRSAIMHVNQASAATTIVIPDGIYALAIPGQSEDAAASGDLDLTSTQGITLVGGGAFATVIDAQQLDRVFDVTTGATATLRGLTIRNGNADQGGGIRNAETLTVSSSLVTTNTAENSGGGISSNGMLTVTGSSIEANRVTSRLFATGGGGVAIVGNPGTSSRRTVITGSSIVGNTSAVAGGGLLANDAELTLTNVTIAGNTAERSDGGGVHVTTTGTSKQSSLTSVTIAGNAAPSGSGGGLMTATSTPQVQVSNSIIADNSARTSPAVEGLITSDGSNLFGQPSATMAGWRTLSPDAADFDQVGTSQAPLDPQLLPLERSSGIVQTRAPVPSGRSSNDELAGTASLALTPGLPIVYSTVELEPNNSRGEAMRLDDRGWSLDSDLDIANSTTIPHVTITGTGDGTFDYFSFTVSEPNTTAVFDIDNGSLAAGEEFDTELFLFDSSDNLLATNDNAAIDVGSTSGLDSRIEHTFTQAGYYTIAVGAFESSHAGDGHLTGNAPPVGMRYVLGVSVDHHILAPTTYNPAADETFFPISGTATNSGYLFSASEGLLPFQEAQNFAVGVFPYSVVLGDVNNDGLDDIVTANRLSQNVSVLRGNGDGTFQAAQNFATGRSPQSVVLGDVNRDGIADILAANAGSEDVSVLRGNGDGTFQAAQNFATGSGPVTVVLGDVNGDGLDDIVTANAGSDNVSVLKGNGDGTFQAAQNFAAGSNPQSVVLGDVNGDGTDDIVTANRFSANVSVLKGNGDGTFQAALNFTAGNQPYSVVLGDVSGDGIDDIVAANYSSDNVSVLRGNGDGTFQDAQNFDVGNSPRVVVLGDVNGDGIDDIVTANSFSNDVSVLRGNGNGTFQAAQNFAADRGTISVALGDVNGDGIDDIVTANPVTDNVSVLSGNRAVVFSFSPVADVIDVIPAVGRPFLFTEFGGQAYWLSTFRTGEYSLWSFSPEAGVRRRAVFASTSRPSDLVATEMALTIKSDSMLFIFDPSSDSLAELPIPDGTFQAAQNFTAGNQPSSVVLGDVNGDGIDDIVTANRSSNSVSVLKGNGDGTFQPALNFATGDRPFSVVLDDVDGDGFDDIVTANLYGSNVSVLKGNGDSTFQAAQNFATGSGPRSVVVGDVSGDGIDDIVTANRSSNSVSVLKGNGDGTFQPAMNFSDEGGPISVVLGDVSGDGIDDIVTANRSSNSVGILKGNGDGTFQARQSFAAGDVTLSVTLGDVNDDGFNDILAANAFSADVSVLIANGDGTFQTAQNFGVEFGASFVTLRDINGDGIDDIITANPNSNNVSVLQGNGDGTFQPKQNFATAPGPYSVVLGDVNGDGLDDIVTANGSSDNVGILIGNGKSDSTDVVQLPGGIVTETMLVRADGEVEFQPLAIDPVDSAVGMLQRTRDYVFARMSVSEDKLLALVQLTDSTTRPDELQLLLINAPKFDENGNVLPSAAENLTLNSNLRLTGGGDQELFAHGDRIFLTGEIVGSGIGSELLVFDRTSGLRLVSDLLPGSQSSEAHGFVAVGDDVYFTALASRIDNNTQQPVLRRELFVIDATGNLRAVRAGQEVTVSPSAVNGTLFFGSQLNAGDPTQLLQFDTSQEGVAPAGSFESDTGNIAGTVFLDRNSDGRRNAGEPGRPGVILFVDVNGNGRHEASEPSAVTRLDDPATSEDETGQYGFFGLSTGEARIREVSQAGFAQTSPLQVLPTAPELTLLGSATPASGTPGLGLPSVIGDSVVYVDQTNAPASQLVVNGEAVKLTIPGEATAIQSIGSAHAQDGSSIVFTATLVDGRELVLERDSRGDVRVVVDTGQAITSQLLGGVSSLTTLADIEDGRNGGFDSLSIADGSIGFLAQSDDNVVKYYLGGGADGRFVEFTGAQTILEGNNEIFVDRIVEGTGAVLSGEDLFLDKATLDAQVGGNTGWRITTRSGDEILPLTFFDRVFDVSVSGQSAVFRASDVSGDESIFLAKVDGGVTRLAGTTSTIPGSNRTFRVFGSEVGESLLPSAAVDRENTVFLGGGDFALVASPNSLSLGDVTGDGIEDIVTANSSSNNVSVLKGNGDGTFQAAQSFPTGAGPISVALGDIDGDGIEDIVTANYSYDNLSSNNVSVLKSNGDGTFQTAQSLTAGYFPVSVVVGDVDGDGIEDIVTANLYGEDVSILRSNGDGTFQAAQNFAVEDFPYSVVLEDVSGDGIEDIVTGNADNNSVSVLSGNGDGTFQTPQKFAVGDGPYSLVVGDVDGDGIKDIVTANEISNNVSVLKGIGNGTFQSAQSFAVGDGPASVVLGDIDGDGIEDIVTANSARNTISVLKGTGNGTFQVARNIATGDGPESVVIGDVNGDGVDDIITANSSSNSVSVLEGNRDGTLLPQLNLYAKLDGETDLRKIADRADFQGQTDFPGQVLTDLAISHDAISGDAIVFHATFSGGTEAIYSARLASEPVASVTVVAGQTTSGVLFGASAEAGTIRGTSFTDLDVDGVFDGGEDGNVGRTVFLDANLNGQLDDSEISTVTDSNGEFVFNDLPAEKTYVVREDLSGLPGLAVTVPQTLAAATVRLGAAGTVEVVLGSIDSGALGESADGVVQGVVFNDTDGNGVRGDSSAEPGIPNLTVFVDENGDGILNGGERSSQTTADGSYTIDQLRGTLQAVRVVLPGSTTDQTSPLGNLFTKSTLRTVDSPVEVITGDFNADGVDDIATTINQASEVRLFLNDGSGGFVAGESLEVSGGPGSIEVGRFLGPDGGDGLVVGHRTTSSVKVLTRQPDGSFNTLDLITPQDVQAGGQFAGFGNAPFIVTTGDFNADGKDDIAVVSQNALPAGGAVALFLSDGDGTFTHEQTLTLPKVDADFPTAITAGLINAGGTVDLAVSNLGTANVTILSNSGVAGSNRFSIDQHLPVLGRAPSSVQFGDLDGDGDNEIVTTNLLSNSVSVFDNNGDGTFGSATLLTAGRGPAFAELIDLDQNGSLDIAFSNSDAGNRFGILRNRGDGTFLAAEASGLALLSDGTLAFSLAIGRFDDDNGDGVIDNSDTPDVVVSNRSGESLNADAGSLTVGLNAIVPGALSVELPTDTRTANGLNFGLRTINLSPEISAPTDPAAIDEDAGQQTVVLTGITTGGEMETLQVSVSSDNTSLIVPTVTFDADAGTATVRYTPSDDQSGSARVTVTVRDAGIDGSFNAIDPDSDDGVAMASFNVVVNPVNDLPPAEADTFGVLLENGAAVLNVLANDDLANPDTGELLTILFTGQPASGTVTIVNDGQQLQYTPAAGFIGQETFSYIVSDNQFTAQGSVTVNVTSNVTPSELLTVSSFTPNPSGFDVTFSEAFNASLLNLYATQSLGPADIVVTGASAGILNGSLITDAAAGSATFIKTGEQLAPGTYTVSIRSANDSFVTGDGDLLDGDSNGTGGDDFSTVFTVAPLSPETVTVGIPDFTRGFGQAVNIPADGVGIPLTISRGTGISALNLKLNYDSALLDVTGFVATAAGILADFNVATGSLALSKSSEFTADAGPLTVGYFSATVPDDALYTSKHLVRISDLQVFDDSVETLAVPSVADSAIHVAAFAGDANASRSYNSPDTTLTLRQSTDRIDGLTLYPLADPALISDVTFDLAVLANDATVVQRLITNVDVPAVADLPTGIDPLPARGADPILSIPQNLTARLGQTITVPVQLEVTESSGITVSGLDVAISYDASQFAVSNVRVGTLLTDNDLSAFVASANTATPGQLLVTASSAVGTSLLAQNTTGDVFLIDFTVLPTASGGSSAINLLANSGGLITGIADNDLSDLILSPAPTNAANDSIDGLFTVTTDVTLVERSGDGQLIVRDASPAGLNNALTFTLDGATLVITESVLPIVAAFGQQITDHEVRVALADLSTSTVNVQFLAGDDSADGSALTASASLRLDGGSGNDTLTGGGGADVLLGGKGDDDLDGGGGIDVLNVTEDGHLSITTTQTFGQGTDSFANIEQAVLEGGARNNRLDASAATIPVTLLGQAGNDTLLGGSAADRLDGGDGFDFVKITGSNIVLTDASAPGTDGDTLISLEGLVLVASVRGSSIDASGYTLGPVTIVGSSGNDTLKGGADNDVIFGGSGSDSIEGGAGADVIAGGAGRDSLTGDVGDDLVRGGSGRDLIDGGVGSDTMSGGGGADTISGGDGTDLALGGGGRDSIDGDDGADTLFGGSGPDNIAGGLGADRLNGVDRDDTFSQVVDRDTLIGGNRLSERRIQNRPALKPGFQLPPASVTADDVSMLPTSSESVSRPGEFDSTMEIDTAFSAPLLAELLEL